MKQASRNRARTRATKTARGGGNHPPQISTNISFRHKYRFVSTNGALQTIGSNDLCAVAGGVCTVANNTLSLIAAAVKLHRVQVWTPPATQGSSATCSLNWKSTSFSPNLEVSDSTMSVTTPAYISAVPPAGSQASFWAVSGSGQDLFDLVAPSGSIIDVDLTVVLNDGVAGASYTVAAATLGVLYFLPLDGGSDVYTPVSLSTTT